MKTRETFVGERMAENTQVSSGPKQAVSFFDALAVTVGIVIGAGIFGTPSLVASFAGSEMQVYAVWIAGGVVSLIGALVYAELTTTYPHTGGEYHYLTRAYGNRLAFLFAWARLSVVQTGSIAAFAFVCGDYLGGMLPLGAYSSAIYAVLIVSILTGINIRGVREGTGTQNLLTSVEVLGVLIVIAAGFIAVAPPAPVEPAATTSATVSSVGWMMMFVLFTYGGWNEAAYVSGELYDARRNMIRVLVGGIAVITFLYVLVNIGYLHALGLKGVADSKVIAADVMRKAFGDVGAAAISVFVAISALTSANATIFTGARTSYAFGCDFPALGFLGRWSPRTSTPVNALIVQALVALALVMLGMTTRSGLQTMIDYTAPVFWFFFLLTGAALFVLRAKEPGVHRPFRVPLYPITPILFCLTCAYLLYSSLAYARVGALAGVGVVAVGALLLIFVKPTRLSPKNT